MPFEPTLSCLQLFAGVENLAGEHFVGSIVEHNASGSPSAEIRIGNRHGIAETNMLRVVAADARQRNFDSADQSVRPYERVIRRFEQILWQSEQYAIGDEFMPAIFNRNVRATPPV